MSSRIADLLRRGEVAAHAGRRGEARHNFRAVLTLDPTNVPALLWLAWLSDNPRASLVYIARVLERDPDNPRAHAALQWARRRVSVSAPENAPVPHHLELKTQVSWKQPGLLALLGLLIVLAGVALAHLLPGNLPVSVALAPTSTPSATPTPPHSPTPTLSPTLTPSHFHTPTPSPAHTPTSPHSHTPALSPTSTPAPSSTLMATPGALPTAPPLPPSLTPAPISTISSNVRWIDVDLTHQQLAAYEGDRLVRVTAISSGLSHTPTPAGQFHIWIKLRYDDMTGPSYYLPNVPYVMYFHGGYGLHGTYWHASFGHPMSHGCVNLPLEEAEWLYFWSSVGTMVNIHY
jgi:lipoprotein-anchoring transpeptidase ErfK/SrfK